MGLLARANSICGITSLIQKDDNNTYSITIFFKDNIYTYCGIDEEQSMDILNNKLNDMLKTWKQ